MKYFVSLCFVLAVAAGCKEKKMTEDKLEKKLMTAMSDYLVQHSSFGVVATVKDVIFDDRIKNYYCEFRVNMRSANKDTTGTMIAIISKDFKTVERAQ